MNTGFVTKLSKGDHKVHLEYRTPAPLTGNMNNPETIWQDNRYIGALLLNGNLKFHRNNVQTALTLKKTDVWTKLDPLKAKFSVEIDRPALFFYNMALAGNGVLGARLLVDGKDIKSTYKRVSPLPYGGLFGMGAKILTQGDHEIQVEYVSGGSN